ncbi:MAG: tRNA (guanosine(37)-N1)-methyltransferase TrmD [Hyphomicrobiales bacterium]|nr:tRNA (guanosine(37)-N1)-methyltransferase TrmD [Hyphomicrobiales bacterium]
MTRNTWKVTTITTTPEIFPGPLDFSNVGRSLKEDIWSLEIIRIDKFKDNKKLKIDSPPSGGGPGMILRADVVIPIIMNIREKGDKRPIIIPAPRGRRYEQEVARGLIKEDGIIIICGRFEGIDQRIVEATGATELSIGDYILTNGDIAAISIIDSCVRLLDGVINTKESISNESYENGLLEHPQYTLPRNYEGHQIPPILLTGNHKDIKSWRLKKSMEITKKHRPDLLRKYKKIIAKNDS